MIGERSIAVIGAGMAGLSCARRLAAAGLSPVIFDKGRGVGGRLATRRTFEGLQFDHGAQYVTARKDGFRELLADMRQARVADVWEDSACSKRFVGTPGMTALAKHLAEGLDVRANVKISNISGSTAGWIVTTGAEKLNFQRVVITAPAQQAAVLLGPTHALAADLEAVEINPCLTLMAAFGSGQPEPFVTRRDPEDPLSWIALNSAKPARPAPPCWVAQAGPKWSAAHLEAAPAVIAQQMLRLLCDRLGTDPTTVRYAVAHRWRYANVAEPLGRPFLRDETGTLYLGGDWCLEARVEAAWTSGVAIAQDMLQGM